MSVASHKVDVANMGLILVSAVLAWLLPFQLFVASYVVLGPLHYLTEIGWLHGRNYFKTTEAKPVSIWQRVPWLLVGIVLFTTLVQLKEFLPASLVDDMKAIGPYQGPLILAGLLWSVTWVLPFSQRQKLFYAVGLGVGTYLLTLWYDLRQYLVLIPTLIHVFVFTALFMVQGAMTRGTWVTWLSVTVLVLSTISFFAIPALPTALFPGTGYWQEAWKESGLINVANLLTTGERHPETVLPEVIRWQAFISFAYTYHYLNWFSKVEIIKWHQVPMNWLVLAGLGWIASVALYVADVGLGMQLLFGLSMLHVALEFPLNWHSLKGLAPFRSSPVKA